MKRRCTKAVLVTLAFAVSSGSTAQQSVLSVEAEPLHRTKMQNEKYRVYDVLLEPNKEMLFHQHMADSFAVMLSNSEITNERVDGQGTQASTKLGNVAFSMASPAKPLAHRILLRGGEPFRVVVLELLQPPAVTTAPPPDGIDPALTKVRESPRGTAYRLRLASRSSARLPAAADAFLVCLSSARVVQTAAARNSAWECRAGDFRVLEGAGDVTLENDAATAADLIVVSIP